MTAMGDMQVTKVIFIHDPVHVMSLKGLLLLWDE